ncbi:MFS transporter [Paenibacillus macquariensis]|uniref:Major Facilitator Superfamily protein n=1 Tax=Paenibacillus macquariensis TaxID=948756 RepID=A0ABY1JPZ3_9BACL|nr:MFS transporter [Paenibacillus macquariensis]MEC0094098.1 MFS transporter [Paenibacillus macquariensis]SIQ56281.1 Major Facilitator Superfamily protein [Paenibacillus macquariensis]
MSVSVLAALSLLFTMWIRVGQPKQGESTMELNVEPVKRKKGMHWNDFIEPKALPISLVGFLLAVSYSSLAGFMATYTNEIHQSQMGGIFFVAFAIMIVLFRPLVGKVFDKHNEHYVYYPGIVLFTIGMYLLSQANSGTIVLVAGFIMGAGYGALFSCFHALAIVQPPEHRRGIANATFFLLFDFGYGVGSYFMGLIASFTNYRMMYFSQESLRYFQLVCTMVCTIARKQSLQNHNAI